MTRVLILGANGQLARNTTRVLLEGSCRGADALSRQASRLKNPAPERVKIVDGDVLDGATCRLRHGGSGYRLCQSGRRYGAGRPGPLSTRCTAAGLKRLIFISSMGIYRRSARRNVPQRARSLPGLRGADRGIRSRLHDPASGLVHARSQKALPDHTEGRAFPGHDIALDSLSRADRHGL